MKRTEQKARQVLSLRKCAYIFDCTYSNYFYGSKEQINRRNAVQKELKKHYESPIYNGIPYTAQETTIYRGDKMTQYYIEIDGQPHPLNALQIKSISGEPESIINHRRQRNFERFEGGKEYRKQSSIWLISDRFSSLTFESYVNDDDIGYYRIHFKRNIVTFILDDRSGDIYTAETVQHLPTTRKELKHCLEIKSKAARAAFDKVLDFLTETAAQDATK